MQRTATLLVFGAIAAIATRGDAQSTKELVDSGILGPKIEIVKRTFEVQVTTKGDSLAPEAESYLTRNLRSLADVRLVGKGAFIHLYISVTDLTNGANTHAASLLSVVVTYPFQDEQLEYFLGPPVNDPQEREKRSLLQDTEAYETTIVKYAGAGKLREACEQLVTALDIKYLKPSRDVWMQIDKGNKGKPAQR